MPKTHLSAAQTSKHLSVIRKIIQPAGELILKHRGAVQNSQIKTKAKSDYVTAIDRRSQKIILDGLMKSFPTYGVLAEEDGVCRSADRMWIVDPIDGTTNFIQNIPSYCVSVGLRENGKIILGAVYDPLHDEYFTASSGHGAKMNKKRISVSGTKTFEDAIFATGFPFRCKERFPAYQESFSRLFYKIGGMRRLGSAALDLCYVACGRYDGYWEVGLQIWDSAAASLIVSEAGGKVSDFKGADSYLQTGDTLAGNPLMHKHALKIIRQIPALQKNSA